MVQEMVKVMAIVKYRQLERRELSPSAEIFYGDVTHRVGRGKLK
jgi:hypothetical protein